MLDVLVISPQKKLFEGRVSSAIFPGERGVFEILAYHKPLLSRLISGIIVLEQFRLNIKRGVVKVQSDKVTAIVEQE